MKKRKTPVYAVIRVGDYPSGALENCITIKEIVWSLEEAEAEVKRLNELNRSKDSKYFWQYTRLVDAVADEE